MKADISSRFESGFLHKPLGWKKRNRNTKAHVVYGLPVLILADTTEKTPKDCMGVSLELKLLSCVMPRRICFGAFNLIL